MSHRLSNFKEIYINILLLISSYKEDHPGDVVLQIQMYS